MIPTIFKFDLDFTMLYLMSMLFVYYFSKPLVKKIIIILKEEKAYKKENIHG